MQFDQWPTFLYLAGAAAWITFLIATFINARNDFEPLDDDDVPGDW